jgi:DNA invertase Pin-like site-specific DNA recombinase
MKRGAVMLIGYMRVSTGEQNETGGFVAGSAFSLKPKSWQRSDIV